MFGKKLKGDPKCGCGISWLWMLPESHWATPACRLHDALYDWHNGEEINLPNAREQRESICYEVKEINLVCVLFREDGRKLADNLFLEAALKLPNSNKFQAYGLYLIVRVVGWLWWK